MNTTKQNEAGANAEALAVEEALQLADDPEWFPKDDALRTLAAEVRRLRDAQPDLGQRPVGGSGGPAPLSGHGKDSMGSSGTVADRAGITQCHAEVADQTEPERIAKEVTAAYERGWNAGYRAGKD